MIQVTSNIRPAERAEEDSTRVQLGSL